MQQTSSASAVLSSAWQAATNPLNLPNQPNPLNAPNAPANPPPVPLRRMPFRDLLKRGERSATGFDGTTKELGRYFSKLESLYDQHGVIDNQEMKTGALKYLTMAALDCKWKSSDTLKDPTKSYNDFKTEMYCLYPGSSEDVSTVHHLDALVGKCTGLGIKTVTELGDYHLDFKTISKYLIGKNHMSKAKQAQALFRGFQPELEQQI
ncbi:hypothetical protein EI94DRAFT_1804466 [Lactarius quietus]|nr:hypothetical protein EI94DRAFT_1804466 [Lactarius quietus]